MRRVTRSELEATSRSSRIEDRPAEEKPMETRADSFTDSPSTSDVTYVRVRVCKCNRLRHTTGSRHDWFQLGRVAVIWGSKHSDSADRCAQPSSFSSSSYCPPSPLRGLLLNHLLSKPLFLRSWLTRLLLLPLLSALPSLSSRRSWSSKANRPSASPRLESINFIRDLSTDPAFSFGHVVYYIGNIQNED